MMSGSSDRLDLTGLAKNYGYYFGDEEIVSDSVDWLIYVIPRPMSCCFSSRKRIIPLQASWETGTAENAMNLSRARITPASSVR